MGIADHFGWAIAVTASADHDVVDRRRIKLVEAGVTPAPIHYDSGRLDVAQTAALAAEVRASIARATSLAFDELAASLPGPVASLHLRTWPADFPADIETQRRPPYEARADGIMYRQVLAEAAEARRWRVELYDAKQVEAHADALLGDRSAEVLLGPRARLGAPWSKDHRVALAATIVAG